MRLSMCVHGCGHAKAGMVVQDGPRRRTEAPHEAHELKQPGHLGDGMRALVGRHVLHRPQGRDAPIMSVSHAHGSTGSDRHAVRQPPLSPPPGQTATLPRTSRFLLLWSCRHMATPINFSVSTIWPPVKSICPWFQATALAFDTCLHAASAQPSAAARQAPPPGAEGAAAGLTLPAAAWSVQGTASR
jgi:hypothetical protein